MPLPRLLTPKAWRPWPLRSIYILPFIGTTLLLSGLLQLLIHACSPSGCPILGTPSTTQVSIIDRVVYQGLPPTFAVGFSFAWLVIHHDILRLEPWFQLSSGGAEGKGVNARDSLLTEYGYWFPYESVWYALKRKHYAILLTYLITLISSLGISPLISGIFSPGTVRHTIPHIAATQYTPQSTTAWLTSAIIPGNFTDPWFEYIQHQVPLPAFTTAEYALWPVELPEGKDVQSEDERKKGGAGKKENAQGSDRNRGPVFGKRDLIDDILGIGDGGDSGSATAGLLGRNETFTASTTLYEAELECRPATGIFITSERYGDATNDTTVAWWWQYLKMVYTVHIPNPFAEGDEKTKETGTVKLVMCFEDREWDPRYEFFSKHRDEWYEDAHGCQLKWDMDGHAVPQDTWQWGIRMAPWVGHSDVLLGAEGGGGAGEAAQQSIFWNIWLGQYPLGKGTGSFFENITHIDPANVNLTAVFCRPRYFFQEVSAGFDRWGGVREGSLVRRGKGREEIRGGLLREVFERQFTYVVRKMTYGRTMYFDPEPGAAPSSTIASATSTRLGNSTVTTSLATAGGNNGTATTTTTSAVSTAVAVGQVIKKEYAFGKAAPHGNNTQVMVHAFAQMKFCPANRNVIARQDRVFACAALPPKGLLTHAALLVENPAGGEDGPEGDVTLTPGDRMMNATYMGEVLKRSFKGIFACAISAGMNQKISGAIALKGEMGRLSRRQSNGGGAGAEEGAWTKVMVERTAIYRGYSVSEKWTRVLQGILALFSVLLLLTWIYTTRRPLALDGEPNSITESLYVLAGDPALAGHVQGAEYCSKERLRRLLKKARVTYRARLVGEEGQGTVIDVIENEYVRGVTWGNDELQEETPLAVTRGIPFWTENTQWQLSLGYSVLLALATAGLAAGLYCVYYFGEKNNGFPTWGSTSSIKYKLVYTYIPFVVSSAISPILASLSKIHCMIAPYALLQRPPKARFDSSLPSHKIISLNFDATPPQFQFFTAVWYRQFTIAGLCIAFLASNILTVTLTSLFSPFPVEEVITGIPMNGTKLPMFNMMPIAQGAVESTILANLTQGEGNGSGGRTVATRWTTGEYYVLPFVPQLPANIFPSAPPSGSADTGPPITEFTGETLGLGLAVSCKPMPFALMSTLYPGLSVESNPVGQLSAEDAIRLKYYYDYDGYGYPPSAGEGNITANGILRYKWTNDTLPVNHNITMVTLGQFWDRAGTHINGSMDFEWQQLHHLPSYDVIPEMVRVRCNFSLAAATVRVRVEEREKRVLDLEVADRWDTNRTKEVELAMFGDIGLSTTWMDLLKEPLIKRDSDRMMAFKSCPTTHCWANYLLKKIMPELEREERESGLWEGKERQEIFIPKKEKVAEALETLMRRMMVVALSMYNYPNMTEPKQNVTFGSASTLRRYLDPSRVEEFPIGQGGGKVLGAVTRTVERVGVSRPLMVTSMAVLGFIFLVLVYRLFKRHKMRGHLPTSLAGTFAVLYAARPRFVSVKAVEGEKEVSGVEMRKKSVGGGEWSYRFGPFGRRDGDDSGEGEALHYGVYCVESWEEEGGDAAVDDVGGEKEKGGWVTRGDGRGGYEAVYPKGGAGDGDVLAISSVSQSSSGDSRGQEMRYSDA